MQLPKHLMGKYVHIEERAVMRIRIGCNADPYPGSAIRLFTDLDPDQGDKKLPES